MSRSPGSFPSAASPDRPQIPDYELVRKIGAGGYGEVWLARGITGAWRAAKLVGRDRFSDTAPFEREFRGVKESMALSSDAGQLALLHVGRNEAADFFYYVMELADDATRGREIDPATYVPLTLKELRARRGRLPVAECLRHALEIARALAALHTRGLLHRDIKPSNIILVNGSAKLADIGLVATTADAHTFVGTDGFVPPEGPGSASADVFALGKVLYELATGLDRAEFPQMPDDLGSPAERKAFFGLNRILLRACDPVAHRRYRGASELVADLEALQAGRAPRGQRGPALPLGVAALVAAGIAGIYFTVRTPAAKPRPIETVAAPVSPSRQLVAQAWKVLHGVPEPFRPELDAAGDLCRRAAELDPADADAWAAWSQVDSWYVAQSIDQSTTRRESARAKAARAMSLAPESYEARLAYACSLLRSLGFNKPSAFTPETEALLRTLLQERPAEPRALLALGHLLYGRGMIEESTAPFDRLAQVPGWAATAYNGKGWVLFSGGRHDEAVAAAERSIAAKPFFGNLGLVAYVARTWWGDLDRAQSYVDRLSAAELREDIGLGYAVQVYWWRRDSKAMHHLLRNAPRDWLASGSYWGPRDYWVGAAYQLDGNREAANFAWRKALRVVEERIAREPGIEPARLQVQKARLHALLGEREASRAAFAALRQLGTDGPSNVEAALLGDAARALPALRHASWATLRYLPDLDPLRDHPDFQALLAEAANDPRRSPHARPTSH